jgi:di/tricarboxylate transporter
MDLQFFQIGMLLTILGIALVFFSRDWVSPDVVALGVMLSLVFTGLVEPVKAFAGFGSDTVMMIAGLLILTAALMRTGVVDVAGRLILQQTGRNPNRLLIVIMITSATLSAFMSNTASAAFFLPIVFGIARRTRISPSRFLMPMAFASILSSSVTLVSTSTNIVVSGVMQQYRLDPIQMFEMSPVGIPICIFGILYLIFFGRKIIPERVRLGDGEPALGMRVYLSEIVLLSNSPLVGRTLRESGLGNDLDLNVVRIIRSKNEYHSATPETVLKAGDILIVEGNQEQIIKVKDITGIQIKADAKLSDPTLKEGEAMLVEALVPPHSPLIGETLKSFHFRERFGIQVLGLDRMGMRLRRKMSRVPLRMGDVLLLQGRKNKMAALEEDRTLQILGLIEHARPNLKKAGTAVSIFIMVLVIATLKPFGLTLPLAVLVGVLLVFLTRCITPEEAYREIEWKVVLLVGAMLSLGVAMEDTGTARYLSGLIVGVSRDAGPTILLAVFFLLTVLLTQPMSNQAAAIVILPIAIETALQLGYNPRTFAMMVAVAASCSYLTPLEPACLLVYGPGRYKFSDFLKVGAPLTLVIFVIALILVPMVWPL